MVFIEFTGIWFKKLPFNWQEKTLIMQGLKSQSANYRI